MLARRDDGGRATVRNARLARRFRAINYESATSLDSARNSTAACGRNYENSPTTPLSSENQPSGPFLQQYMGERRDLDALSSSWSGLNRHPQQMK